MDLFVWWLYPLVIIPNLTFCSLYVHMKSYVMYVFVCVRDCIERKTVAFFDEMFHIFY